MIPNRTSIQQLFESFPSLPRAAENFKLDAGTLETADSLLAWAKTAKLSEAGKQAAYFIATILNDFRDLPADSRFDFATAISRWDKEHWAAFRTWTANSLV